MKGYKTVLQEAVQRLGSVNSLYSRYSRYAQSLGRELLSTLYDDPKNRDPYYDRRSRNRPGNPDYGKFIIPAGTGYPELKPVGSYI